MFIELTRQHIGKVLIAKDAITSVRERQTILSNNKRKSVEVHCITGGFGSEVIIVTETLEEIKALLGEGEN